MGAGGRVDRGGRPQVFLGAAGRSHLAERGLIGRQQRQKARGARRVVGKAVKAAVI